MQLARHECVAGMLHTSKQPRTTHPAGASALFRPEPPGCLPTGHTSPRCALVLETGAREGQSSANCVNCIEQIESLSKNELRETL